MSRAAATKTAMAVWMSSATISALIATANRCATSSIGNGVTEGNGIQKIGSHRIGCVAIKAATAAPPLPTRRIRADAAGGFDDSAREPDHSVAFLHGFAALTQT